VDFIHKKNVSRFKHHERPVDMLWGLEVMGQLRVQTASDFPCNGFTQERLTSSTWPRNKQVW
jgi:hypothetical protein